MEMWLWTGLMFLKLQILKGALIRTLHVLIRRDCAPFNGAFE
jgi:hypothetical protein